MALPVNQIHDQTFLSLSGDPTPLMQMVEMHQRAGVEGTTLARLGKRGRKFTLQSRVDQPDRVTARSVYSTSYLPLIGHDPVDLTWWDIAMSGESFSVVVLDVRIVRLARMILASGGLNPPGLAVLVCDWDLLAIGVSS